MSPLHKIIFYFYSSSADGKVLVVSCIEVGPFNEHSNLNNLSTPFMFIYLLVAAVVHHLLSQVPCRGEEKKTQK